jgi:hypothetical protein
MGLELAKELAQELESGQVDEHAEELVTELGPELVKELELGLAMGLGKARLLELAQVPELEPVQAKGPVLVRVQAWVLERLLGQELAKELTQELELGQELGEALELAQALELGQAEEMAEEMGPKLEQEQLEQEQLFQLPIQPLSQLLFQLQIPSQLPCQLRVKEPTSRPVTEPAATVPAPIPAPIPAPEPAPLPAHVLPICGMLLVRATLLVCRSSGPSIASRADPRSGFSGVPILNSSQTTINNVRRFEILKLPVSNDPRSR